MARFARGFCANLTHGHVVQPDGAAIQRPDTGTLSESDSCTVDRSLDVTKPKVSSRKHGCVVL